MFKQFVKNVVLTIVKDYIEPKIEQPPEGYSPLEEIRKGLYSWIQVPFNNVNVWCQLRCLGWPEKKIRGAVTLIDIAKNHEHNDKDSFNKLMEIKDIQEDICRGVFNRPKFDDIEKMILGEDNVIRPLKEELKKLEEKDLSSLSDKEKTEIINRINKLRVEVAYLLPENTMAFCTSWGFGIDVSDIKKINEQALLDAAILASRWAGKLPTDFLTGHFLKEDMSDLNTRATQLYDDYMHVKQREYELTHKRK